MRDANAGYLDRHLGEYSELAKRFDVEGSKLKVQNWKAGGFHNLIIVQMFF